MNAAHRVLRYLSQHRWALVGLLERLALAESPSAEPRAQYEILDILSEALVEMDSRRGVCPDAGAVATSTRGLAPASTTPQCNSCSDTATPSGRSGRLG